MRVGTRKIRINRKILESNPKLNGLTYNGLPISYNDQAILVNNG